MKNVLVTGASGQLGMCIKSIEATNPNLKFIFTDRLILDITDSPQVQDFFDANSIDWCINCAAYTAVDKAELDQETAETINITGVINLAKAAKKKRSKVIHISTDFVFDGNASIAYQEDDQANPLGVYGHTKLRGEQALKETLNEHFIIRTSWLYSEYGHNFLKTMLRLAQSKTEINVVSDQIGTPTYAKDLAVACLEIIKQDSEAYGIYHFSNEGVASWYDLAKAIFSIKKHEIIVNPIHTEVYPTPAMRPKFSVLDKSKIKNTFNLTIPYWRDSLENAITNI